MNSSRDASKYSPLEISDYSLVAVLRKTTTFDRKPLRTCSGRPLSRRRRGRQKWPTATALCSVLGSHSGCCCWCIRRAVGQRRSGGAPQTLRSVGGASTDLRGRRAAGAVSVATNPSVTHLNRYWSLTDARSSNQEVERPICCWNCGCNTHRSAIGSIGVGTLVHGLLRMLYTKTFTNCMNAYDCLRNLCLMS